MHIALSNESGKPMVVHVRDAWPEVLRALDEGSAERVVIHCFSGDAAIARECAARLLGQLRRQRHVSEERAPPPGGARGRARPHPRGDRRPFLAPQKLRGTDNEPSNVMFTIAEVARVRDEDVRNVAEATARNAEAAFPGIS